MAKTSVRKANTADGSRGAEGNGGPAGARRDGRRSAREPALERLEEALKAAAAGSFDVRLPARRRDEIGRLEAAYNELAARNASLEAELVRIAQSIGREGRMTERARLEDAGGAWEASIGSRNGLTEAPG